jgi:hypothetical protein
VKLISLRGGTRPTGLTCGAGWPHLAAVGPLLRSHVFWCLLHPSSATFHSVHVMSLSWIDSFLPSFWINP